MPESRYVMIAQMDVDPSVEAEFIDWLAKEHIPAVSRVPGVLSVKRYVAPLGDPKYMIIYELSRSDVPSSRDWNETRKVGRTARMRQHIRNASYRVFREA